MLVVFSMTTLYFFRGNIWLCAIVGTGASISVICHWWNHWYCVILMLVASHDHKSHVAPCSNHLELMNAVVLLMMPSVLHDADAAHFDCLDLRNAVVSLTSSQCHMMPMLAVPDSDTACIGAMTKKVDGTSFCSSWCKECYGAIDDTQYQVMQVNANYIMWPNKWCCTSLSFFSLRNAVVPLTLPSTYNDGNASGVPWVMLCLISVVLI